MNIFIFVEVTSEQAFKYILEAIQNISYYSVLLYLIIILHEISHSKRRLVYILKYVIDVNTLII